MLYLGCNSGLRRFVLYCIVSYRVGESLFTYFASLAYVPSFPTEKLNKSAVNNDRVLKDKFCQKI